MQVGQRVVCVNDGKLPHTIAELEIDCPNWIKKGEKYTIRGFNDNNGIVTGVLLEEVVNPIRFFRLINRSQESSFRLDRFRPLKENEVLSEVEKFEEVF